jgi:2-iminobutanoate/2-iminopropanoate deaminase
MDAFDTFNVAYMDGFGDHRPARSTIAVRELPAGGHVEVEAVAYAPR